jgi:hypothetical protein
MLFLASLFLSAIINLLNDTVNTSTRLSKAYHSDLHPTDSEATFTDMPDISEFERQRISHDSRFFASFGKLSVYH